ncbi:MAG: molecular chaperone TorD family protein [Anaerolineae bacterium]|jgi:TorA maturation chaperone TorD|nr:molecular chaperone TorD family protein [Anaerolineae bacterium]
MQANTINDLSSTIFGESLLFGLLGKLLYADLDKTWLETLIREDIFSEAPFGAEQVEMQHGIELLQRWANENRGGLEVPQFKALQDDNLHLFIGLNKVLAPMWESVYFSEKKLIFQEQTLQVREWYARFGLQAERINKEPDDHIGLEMLFIAHLASLALQAIELNDENKLNDILQAQREFLSEHLLRWGPVWAKLVKQHAATDFYRGIAHLTHGALLAIAETLEIKMPKEVTL